MNVLEQSKLLQKCTGCFACSNVCPFNAIRMKLNSEGFFYPNIDKTVCVECGKCVKICPVKKDFNSDFSPVACYGYQGSDSIRLKSSSGGAFFMLAQYILNQEGVVFGAYFDPDEMIVKHGSTEQIPLEKLMRSKYVQSKIGNCYTQVENELKRDRYVLFCGTPCQIYGLKSYLSKDYDKLLAVDFVCHGVPGTGFFRDMIQSISNKQNAKCIDMTFREKDIGWRKQVMKFYFEDGTEQKYISSSYYYYYYFLQNITLRDSCYRCQFPQNRYSDITLMDYWQIKEDDNMGVSAFTANSCKARKVINEVFGNTSYEIDYRLIQSGFITHDKISSYKRYRRIRDRYIKYYAQNGFEKAILCKNKRIDITLFVIGKLSNYGGKTKNLIRKCLRR